MNKIEVNSYAMKYARNVEQWVVDSIYDTFTLDVKLDWSNKRVASRGGMYAKGPGINMAMHNSYPNNKGQIYRFYEYASYDMNKTIGGFYATDPTLKLEALLLHEISHAIQYFSYRITGTRCKPHGPVFKGYYKQLREHFLNHKLPDQIAMQKEYDEYVSKLNKGVDHVLQDLFKRAASTKA